MIERLERGLDAIGRRLHDVITTWWAWPAFLFLTGLVAVAVSAAATPVGEDVHLFGWDLFGVCEWQQATGRPCASCGMTRSWVWAVRGEMSRAWSYNPAGLLLFLTLGWGGLVGGLRLGWRRPGLLAVPWRPLGFAWGLWFAIWCALAIQRAWF